MDSNLTLRSLPSVDELLRSIRGPYPQALLVSEIRNILETLRERVRAGETVDASAIPAQVLEAMTRWEKPSLRRVINAAGVVLHTNLGRAPLPLNAALEGYSNLEYDLQTGRRGRRDVHTAELIGKLAGKPGLVVNNNAAAVFLVLNELAAGAEVIVSRGELVEIGDGFRIPDIMARSGAILREVGTTNRTRVADYADAITERTRLLMRVHRSNFRISGFTETPGLEQLAGLARERGIPLYEDLGSGCLVNLEPFGVNEPVVADSIRAGVSLVSFSGDKLLGGPQSGIIAGDQDLLARLRRNPLFRALRVDKLACRALESVLRLLVLERWTEIPALKMIMAPIEGIRTRALQFAERLVDWDVAVCQGFSVIGGGSTPEQPLPTWLLSIGAVDVSRAEQALRRNNPPVICRIENDRLVIDLRTVFEEEEEELERALGQARSK